MKATEQRHKERRSSWPSMPEVRHFTATGLEVRSNAKTDEIVISGAPIVYDRAYTVCDMFGEFQETMRFGVASDVLNRGADVRLLFNHDGLPLARTTSGTMSLVDGPTELQFTATLDARQQLANDLAIAIERGDVSQMSCGFIVARDEWNEDYDERTIHAFADLLDVSAVTYPASPTTSIQVAHRLAMEVPVESRARLRMLAKSAPEGRALRENEVAGFRELASALLDPGQEAATPGGTGRLGNPTGNEPTWAPGDTDLDADGANVNLSNADTAEGGSVGEGLGVAADGTMGGVVQDPGSPAQADGTGARSMNASRSMKASTLRLMVEARKRS